MIHVLLPWAKGSGIALESFVRVDPATGYVCGEVWKANASYGGWNAGGYAPDKTTSYDRFIDTGEHSFDTKELAQQAMDAVLMKVGWKLLNEGDKLMVLL